MTHLRQTMKMIRYLSESVVTLAQRPGGENLFTLARRLSTEHNHRS